MGYCGYDAVVGHVCELSTEAFITIYNLFLFTGVREFKLKDWERFGQDPPRGAGYKFRISHGC